jgi:hypothetical protein
MLAHETLLRCSDVEPLGREMAPSHREIARDRRDVAHLRNYVTASQGEIARRRDEVVPHRREIAPRRDVVVPHRREVAQCCDDVALPRGELTLLDGEVAATHANVAPGAGNATPNERKAAPSEREVAALRREIAPLSWNVGLIDGKEAPPRREMPPIDRNGVSLGRGPVTATADWRAFRHGSTFLAPAVLRLTGEVREDARFFRPRPADLRDDAEKAVKEPAFLMPMHRIVRRVEIEHDILVRKSQVVRLQQGCVQGQIRS